jgi:hypothetical protein
MFLGGPAYYTSAILEVLFAVVLLVNRRYVMSVAVVCIVMSLFGAGLGLSTSKECGCLGKRLVMNRSQHLMLCALLGSLACRTARKCVMVSRVL